MKTFFFTVVIIFLLILPYCIPANDEAEKALKAQGYTNIKLTGYKVLACSQSDGYNRGFEATSLAGVRVEGVVCMGAFKGSTIRTF